MTTTSNSPILIDMYVHRGNDCHETEIEVTTEEELEKAIAELSERLRRLFRGEERFDPE